MTDLVSPPQASTNVNRYAEDLELGTSVGKALTLLAAVGSGQMSIGVTALSDMTNIPKSTAFRLLGLLEDRGLIERDGTNYRLGLRIFELGNSIAHCQPRSLRDIARPYLVELHTQTGLSAQLAIRDGADIVYIDKSCGHQRVPSVSHVGGRLPAHGTALGKAMLAHASDARLLTSTRDWLRRRTPYTIVSPHLLIEELRRVRSAGFAVDREECCIGLACIAAPVLDEDNEAVAAISLSGRTPRMVPEDHVRSVRSAATAIARAIGRAGPLGSN